jgi:biotin operon repressor/hypoxanthine-guanine phosphoribosyltransferase
MNNKDKIIELLKQQGNITVSSLIDELGISRQAIHRSLNRLQNENKVIKIGRPPKVFYSLADDPVPLPARPVAIDEKVKNTIDNEFMYITALGAKLMGWDAFLYWCDERKLDVAKTTDNYLKTLYKYNSYKESGLIDGMHKMKTSFDGVYLDKIFYLDFYSIEIFGKTKLGQLLLFAKQSQDRKMINEIVDTIKPEIEKLIKDRKITAVGFIPPTVKRELQLVKQIQKRLNLSVKTIELVKIKTAVAVPQKTLSKIDDRIVNAKTTIAVNDSGKYDNILLIDDAVGSGATLNEVAKKIREKNMCRGNIVGLAIVGSFKGFEVISEV